MSATSGPVVSIIVALHQGAETIEATLDSVIAQGDVAVEVIVVDDRSSDEGPELARRHRARPSVLRSPKPGPAAARNFGLVHAGGEYLVFLDCDDLLKENALRQRLAVARRMPRTTIVVGRHEDLVGTERRAPELEANLSDDTAEALLKANQFAIHGPLVPRAVLSRLEAPFDEDLWGAEDWGLWLRLALQGTAFYLLPEADCLYRRREDSLSRDLARRTDDTIRLLLRAKAWCRATAWPRRLRLELSRRRSLHRWLRHRSHLRVSQGHLRAGVVDAGRAFVAHPLAGATSLPAHALARLWSAAWRRL